MSNAHSTRKAQTTQKSTPGKPITQPDNSRDVRGDPPTKSLDPVGTSNTESHGSSSNTATTSSENGPPRGAEFRVPSPPTTDEIRDKLEQCVSACRNGELSTFRAIQEICQVLESCSISEDQRELTIGSYIKEINSLQAQPAASVVVTQPPAKRSIHKIADDDNEQFKSQVDELIERLSTDPRDENGDDTSDEPPTQKRRLSAVDMPWYDPHRVQHRRPSCAKTFRLLGLFNLDLKSVKFELVNGDGVPEGFPVSQWEKIIKGETIDLDHVFSSLHRVTADEERKGKVGDASFSFGTAEPARKIKSATDWSAAWRKASRAISFVFEHRTQELQDYADYIEREFAAKVPDAHRRIIGIAYDCAVRALVGGGQQILLTDVHRFTHLYSAFIMHDGIAAGDHKSRFSSGSGSLSSRPPPRGSRTEVCNKFNAGTCTFSDADCHYRHICKGCAKSGHGRYACPEKK